MHQKRRQILQEARGRPVRREVLKVAEWRELFVGGLGGGLFLEVTDQFVGKMLPGQIAGMSLKDIVLILLGKYGADRVSGDWKTALNGMATIGIYKVVYPQFVQPIVKGIVPSTSTSHSSGSNPNPSPRPVYVYRAEEKLK